MSSGRIVGGLRQQRAAEPEVRCRFLMTEDGDRCHDPAIAPDHGILLCVTHLASITRFLRGYLRVVCDDDITAEDIERATSAANERREREREAQAGAVVYYVRIGNQCKIGTTQNLTTRLRALTPDEVLATEPGSYALEHVRHQQFAHLRQRGERFAYEAELVDHVAMLRRHFGAGV